MASDKTSRPDHSRSDLKAPVASARKWQAERGALSDEHSESDISVGRRITALRMTTGLARYNFAKHWDLANSSVSQWEAGRCRPTLDTVIQWKRRYGITLDYLYTGDATGLPPNLRSQLAANLHELTERLASGGTGDPN